MIIFICSIILMLVILLVWFNEARIFLFIFHKLTFAAQKGSALHIDKHSAFPESSTIEKNWKNIYQELKNVMGGDGTLPKFHEVDKANYKISFDNAPAWRTIVIKAYGGWFTDNCKMFPFTKKLFTGDTHCINCDVLHP